MSDGRVIRFAYDANGNLTSLTPPGRPAHAFGFTPVDLRAAYTAPDAGAGPSRTQYAHDADRQPTRVALPDGRAVSLGYDGAGRLATVSLARGQITYGYHASTGNVVGATAPGRVSLPYGHDGAVLTGTTWAGPVVGTVGRTYDDSFRLTALSVGATAPITYRYDADGLLVQGGSLTLARDAQNGLLTGTTLGTIADSQGHNGFGELVSYRATDAGSPVFAQESTRDALGRITHLTETVAGSATTFAYNYDLTGQLSEVRQNGALVARYGYDSNGNRESRTSASGTVTGTYDAQDRLIRYGSTTYAHSASGSLLLRRTMLPNLPQTP